MSKPLVLQDRFLGFQRDVGRDQIPSGYCYDVYNMLPYMGAPLRKRGGWVYKGQALTSTYASSGYPRHVCWAPFTGITGGQLLVVEDANNHLLDQTNNVDKGAAHESYQAPFFYRDYVIIPSLGAAAPKKYTAGGGLAALGGSPPFASTGVVHGDRLLLSSHTNNPGKIYYSGAGDPENWDTTTRWVNTRDPVLGMASIKNSLIVFHADKVERIRGTAAPGTTAFNQSSRDTLFTGVGAWGPNAICQVDDMVVWADGAGIYQSDGSSISDLTKQGGIKKYWMDVVSSGPVVDIAVGVWRGFVYVSALLSGGGEQLFLIGELATRSWFRASNIRAKNFAAMYGATNEFYFSNQSTKRVGELSGLFTPSSSNKADANGTAYVPLVETAFFTFGDRAKKRVRFVYLGYDVRGTGSYLDVSFAKTPDIVSLYSAVQSLPETSTYTRRRLPVSRAPNGLSFDITSSSGAAPDDLVLYSIETDGQVSKYDRPPRGSNLAYREGSR